MELRLPHIGMSFPDLALEHSDIGLSFSEVGLKLSDIGISFLHIGLKLSGVGMSFPGIGMKARYVERTFSDTGMKHSDAFGKQSESVALLPHLADGRVRVVQRDCRPPRKLPHW